MKRSLHSFGLGLGLVVLGACGGEPAVGPAPVAPAPAAATCTRGKTIVVVRHAEKGTGGGADPSLSEKGQARAKVLASLLGSAGVTRLVATQYKRTQETLAPLGAKVSLPVEPLPADKTKDLVAQLKAAPDGAFIVVATHSNLVPPIVRELSGTKLRGIDGDLLPEDEFGRIVLLTQACGATKPIVTELSSSLE